MPKYIVSNTFLGPNGYRFEPNDLIELTKKSAYNFKSRYNAEISLVIENITIEENINAEVPDVDEANIDLSMLDNWGNETTVSWGLSEDEMAKPMPKTITHWKIQTDFLDSESDEDEELERREKFEAQRKAELLKTNRLILTESLDEKLLRLLKLIAHHEDLAEQTTLEYVWAKQPIYNSISFKKMISEVKTANTRQSINYDSWMKKLLCSDKFDRIPKLAYGVVEKTIKTTLYSKELEDKLFLHCMKC